MPSRLLLTLPILVVGPVAATSVSIAATGLIYVSYFMCNAGVMRARTQGWPPYTGVVQPGSLGQAHERRGTGV
ncbi:MAG: hypothetical protein M3P84_08210, partial [Chloroflexota bacterium]|nr:hypothetical protein [Chloroflexota bacterium]